VWAEPAPSQPQHTPPVLQTRSCGLHLSVSVRLARSLTPITSVCRSPMLSLLCVCCRDLILTAQSAARTRRGTQKCRASATAEQATCKTTNSSSGEVYCAPCHPSCSSCTTLTNQGCSACTLPLARSVPTNPTSSCEMVTTLPKFFDSLLGLDNFCHPMCLDCTTANTTHFCGGCIANADKNSTYCRCKPGFFLFESSGLNLPQLS
jgi:hypothetical protein